MNLSIGVSLEMDEQFKFQGENNAEFQGCKRYHPPLCTQEHVLINAFATCPERASASQLVQYLIVCMLGLMNAVPSNA